MDYFVGMKIAQSDSYLSAYELSDFFWESFVYEQVVVEVASPHVLQEEVYSVLVLKHIVHTQHERIASLEQYVFFILSILN